MKQKKIYIAIADSFPASTMNVVPFTTRKKAAAHVIERIRKYIEGTPWNPDHWTGYGKTGEHHIDAMYNIDFSMDDVIVYNDHVETSAIFGIAVRNMDDPANAEFGVFKSPDSSVDSLARTLWEGMADGDCEAIDDRDAAIAYLCAMFPGAKATIISLESCFYFDYDGMEYGVTLDYDRDENNELRGEKIIVSDCNDKIKPVTIDRDTRDVRGTLEKFFEKAKSAWVFKNSDVDSLAKNLWDGMYDKGRTIEDDTDAAVDYIRAMFPEAEAFREEADCYYFDYDGGKYFIKPEYSVDEKGRVIYGKITVRDYDGKLEPVTVDRDTPDVRGTLEKFFEKAKSAGDSPDSPAEPSLTDRVAKLEAVVKTLNAEIRKIKKIIKK